MDFINLGCTGLKVSRICLGTMTYGSPNGAVGAGRRAKPAINPASIEAGINFFDTADMYSLGASEEILGRALKEFGPSRDRVVIGTKVFNAMGDDPNQRGLSRKHISTRLTTACGGWAPITWTSTKFIVSIRKRRWKKRLKP